MSSLYAYRYEMAAALQVSDEDAADFLQSQFSNDLRPFKEGQSTYGLWLDNKGKVCADSTVVCAGDELFYLFSEHCSADLIQAKLAQHIIADDVVIEPIAIGPGLALIGEGYGSFLEKYSIQASGEGEYQFQHGLLIYVGRRSELPSVEVVSLNDEGRSLINCMFEDSDAVNVSENWIQQNRLSAGIPAVPAEIGPADLPGEAGFVPDVASLTKGCYLGQEVVARMHNVGRAQRALYFVRGSSTLPEVPAVLQNDAAKQVGELRSVYESEQGWEGVSLLKTRYVELGGSLFLPDGVPVIIASRFQSK